MDKDKSYGNIISTQELKAHLEDNNKARMYEEKKKQLDKYGKKMGKYFKCTHKKTCLGCRREKAYYSYKLAGSDWSRSFWENTYLAIECLYPDSHGIREERKIYE